MANDAQVSTATSPRAAMARVAAAIAMGVGVFGVMIAWCGAAGVVPGGPLVERAWAGPSLLQGDGGVVLAGVAAAAMPWLAARAPSLRAAVATALLSSLALGGLLGLAVLHGAGVVAAAGINTWGVGLWLGLAVVRAGCALPLASMLRRGASIASRDALDRVMLGASLWLLAALTESAMVVRLARPLYTGMAGPALGVAFFGMTLLAGLSALAALARSARWLALWGRVARGGGWRIVPASTWAGAAPTEAWFEGLGACDGVAVRTVAREGAAYREGDLEVAAGRVPLDAARVRRGLALRALAAAGLLAATAAVAAVLVAPLRW